MFSKGLSPIRLAGIARTLRGIQKSNPGMFHCDQATLLQLAVELETAASYQTGWEDAMVHKEKHA